MEEPNFADRKPVIVELEEGKNYAWCACGRSSNQPWCDGSHRVTGFKPTVFTAEKSGKHALCMCKRSGTKPFCDGNHRNF